MVMALEGGVVGIVVGSGWAKVGASDGDHRLEEAAHGREGLQR